MKYAVLILMLLCEFAYSQSAFSFRNPAFVGALKPKIQVQPPNGLLNFLEAYWKLDDAAQGSRVDATGNGNTLADPQANIWTTTGIVSTAAYYSFYSFSGAENILHNTSPSMDNSASWSVNAWAKINSSELGSFQRLIGFTSSGTGLQVYMDGDGGVYYDSGNYDANDNPVSVYDYAPLDVWYNFTITFDYSIGEMNFYVNGTPYAPQYPINAFGSLDEISFFNCYFGGGSGPVVDQPFNGGIDEVGFWSKCLSQSEIDLLYNSGAGKPYSSFTY